MSCTLPFLTEHLPGFNAELRVSNEDFFVEEIPRYTPTGAGTHVFFLMEKSGLTTMEAIGRIASALDIKRRDIGYAGQKDAHGVTRQWISIEHMDPQTLLKRELSHIRFLDHGLHQNKLRVGHLKGNRFVIRLRHIDCPLSQATDRANAILDELQLKGTPNYYGPQRFGNQKNSHWLGKAILSGDLDEFYDTFLGQPENAIASNTLEGRTFFSQGDYQKAFEAWPPPFRDERRLLRELIYQKGHKQKAYRHVNKTMKRFYISAFQSHVFNQVLAARMPDLNIILNGDVAYKHENGACFLVEDPSLEQPRCDLFEISATGPIFGSHMKSPEHEGQRIEDPIIQAQAAEILAHPTVLKKENIKGARRPLRIQPENVSASAGSNDSGEFLELRFELPAGSYATVLIRELLKRDVS
ncbi:MAG: tRNA pseudouridine(13) synthase TruD [Phycisphaeraceae bacterium]|nr:tRNA pseudouridine(13) synthase TruD [Phycisphaeraceae bacterium]